jgi:hypothetical protein
MVNLHLLIVSLSQLVKHLNKNKADYLLLMGVILIGIFIYMAYGIIPTILYSGVMCVIASFIFGLTKPKHNGRNY